MHYRLENGFGETIDSSQGGLPLVYMHNTGAILPSLERELTGRSTGDVFEVVIYPEDGYGYANEDLIQEMAREMFAPLGEIKVGMRVNVKGNDDQSQLVTIKAINDESVVVDGNHPLAGQVLHFEIGILELREPTQQEIEEGGVIDNSATAPGQ
jgi:FKBP-type peptidyl-prolyl cis-trans isomerase SlyD